MGQAVWLSDRGVVKVSGPDAAALLQGVVTNDVEKISPHEACFAALLTPQGKILFDFFVVRLTGAAFALDCNGDQAADLAKRLNFYKLRAKVVIADESADHGIVAYWGEPPELAPGAFRYRDPRAPELGFREILPRARAESVGQGELEAYEALRISLAAPKGGVDFAYGDAFPHEVNFDTLGGVDFHKGCYVGQEVVSRMQHRGGARKRVVRVVLDGPAPEPGTQVVDGDLPVGTLGAASEGFALALLRLNRAEDARAAGRSLKAGEAIVSIP
jgi:folate-binding protein YgfZ